MVPALQWAWRDGKALPGLPGVLLCSTLLGSARHGPLLPAFSVLLTAEERFTYPFIQT